MATWPLEDSVGWPFKVKPYQVQLKALEKSRGRKNYAWFLDLGLGKTIVSLAEYINLLKANEVDRLLVICPNSLKGVWLDEIEKVGFPASIRRAAWPLPYGPAYDVVMLNYEASITTAGRNFIMQFLSGHRTMLVIDESTQVKNPSAKRTKFLILAAKSAAYVRLLSGQPIVQGPHDLWSQLRCLGEFSGMNYYVYKNVFCKLGGFMGKQVIGAKDPAQLNAILNRVSFRAKKDDWLDLPEQIYTTRNVTMTAQQQKHYDEMKKLLVTIIKEKEVDANIVITQMLKLQQISSGFLIDGSHVTHWIPGSNPKIDEVESILQEATGKALISTYFRASVAALRDCLAEYQPAVIQGDMSPLDLRMETERFREDPKCRVNICQVQSAKYGFTFLGGPGEDRCATTIFYENSFSLDARIQFEARNHRIGQDKAVLYIDLPASPIERVVVKALQRKQDIASAIIDYVQA